MSSHLKQQHRVIITGASQGIGAAIAEEYAAMGADLLLVSRSADKLKRVAESCKNKGAKRVEIAALDLSKPESWSAVLAESQRLNFQPDSLINNAGYGSWGDFEKLTLEEQLTNMRLNMDAVVALTHLFLPELKKNPRSYIMNVASTTAYQAIPTFAVYAASKSFVLSFTRAIQHELKSSNVWVTALVPGATDTGFIDRAGLAHTAEKAKKVSMTAVAVARAGVEGLLKGRLEVVPGFINQLSAQFIPVLPKSLIEKAAAAIYKQ